jgi:hypothetical protein
MSYSNVYNKIMLVNYNCHIIFIISFYFYEF